MQNQLPKQRRVCTTLTCLQVLPSGITQPSNRNYYPSPKICSPLKKGRKTPSKNSKKPTNMEQHTSTKTYKASLSRYFYLVGFVLVFCSAAYCFIDRHSTDNAYLILVFLLLLGLIWEVFSHEYISEITINTHEDRLYLTTRLIPFGQRMMSFPMKNLSVRYVNGKIGRGTKPEHITISTLKGDFKGELESSFWKTSTLKEIYKDLEQSVSRASKDESIW